MQPKSTFPTEICWNYGKVKSLYFVPPTNVDRNSTLAKMPFQMFSNVIDFFLILRRCQTNCPRDLAFCDRFLYRLHKLQPSCLITYNLNVWLKKSENWPTFSWIVGAAPFFVLSAPSATFRKQISKPPQLQNSAGIIRQKIISNRNATYF